MFGIQVTLKLTNNYEKRDKQQLDTAVKIKIKNI